MSIFNNKPSLSQAIHEKIAFPLDKKTILPDQGEAVLARTTSRRSGFVYEMGSLWDTIQQAFSQGSNPIQGAIDVLGKFVEDLTTTSLLVDVSVRTPHGLFVHPNIPLRLEGNILQQSWIQIALKDGFALDVKLIFEGGKAATAIPLSLVPFRATSAEVYDEVVAGSGTSPLGQSGGGGFGGQGGLIDAVTQGVTQGGYGSNQSTASSYDQLLGASTASRGTGFISRELMALTQVQAANIKAAAMTYGVNISYILAVIMVESSGNPRATHTNEDGTVDRGIMQINSGTYPSLFRQLPRVYNLPDNVFDPSTNIFCGTLYLSQKLQQYGGDIKKTIIAYNGGGGEVEYFERTGRTYPTTTVYLARFMKYLGMIQADLARHSQSSLNSRLEINSIDTTQSSKNTGKVLGGLQGF